MTPEGRLAHRSNDLFPKAYLSLAISLFQTLLLFSHTQHHYAPFKNGLLRLSLRAQSYAKAKMPLTRTGKKNRSSKPPYKRNGGNFKTTAATKTKKNEGHKPKPYTLNIEEEPVWSGLQPSPSNPCTLTCDSWPDHITRDILNDHATKELIEKAGGEKGLRTIPPRESSGHPMLIAELVIYSNESRYLSFVLRRPQVRLLLFVCWGIIMVGDEDWMSPLQPCFIKACDVEASHTVRMAARKDFVYTYFTSKESWEDFFRFPFEVSRTECERFHQATDIAKELRPKLRHQADIESWPESKKESISEEEKALLATKILNLKTKMDDAILNMTFLTGDKWDDARTAGKLVELRSRFRDLLKRVTCLPLAQKVELLLGYPVFSPSIAETIVTEAHGAGAGTQDQDEVDIPRRSEDDSEDTGTSIIKQGEVGDERQQAIGLVDQLPEQTGSQGDHGDSTNIDCFEEGIGESG